ncbi:hypothetical protein AB1Y20_022750 [Prymnesium parvum]|uniref:Uncharacterized protein n=1 Tax=Prymnesium parvum TaxID=97485 RepID=A0AB34JJP6_PRYPA
MGSHGLALLPSLARHRALLTPVRRISSHLIAPTAMGLALRRRIAAIEGIDMKYNAMTDAHHRQIQELEAALAKQTAHLFKERQAIIEGCREPTDEEVDACSVGLKQVSNNLPDASTAAEDPACVPHFWPTALSQWVQQLPAEAALEVSEEDWKVLAYLRSVRMERWVPSVQLTMKGLDVDERLVDVQTDGGAAVVMTFHENPYMSNTTIEVRCTPTGEVHEVDPPVWKDSFDPTVKYMKKKTKRKNQPAETVVVEKLRPSIFNIFKLPDGDEIEEEAIIAQEFFLASMREDFIPRAGLYYVQCLHGLEAVSNMDDDAVAPRDEARGA